MEYLTNHDLFWVNQIVTGTVNTFNYFALEAACAGQYAYGVSTDVPAQAATLLDRLLNRSPFFTGNRRTAYIAMLTFLNANGYATIVDDEEAVRLMTAVAARSTLPLEAVNALASPAKESLTAIPMRQLITHECNHHARALALLAEGD
jgi:death-on-curing family protein